MSACISSARAASKALRRGERRTLWVDDDLYVYARSTDEEGAIVALNKGGSRTERVSVQGRMPDGTVLTDALSGRAVTVDDGSVNIELGAWEVAVFY